MPKVFQKLFLLADEEENVENKKESLEESRAATTSASAVMEEIKQAKQFLDDGILTEQEFTALKAKLIAKL